MAAMRARAALLRQCAGSLARDATWASGQVRGISRPAGWAGDGNAAEGPPRSATVRVPAKVRAAKCADASCDKYFCIFNTVTTLM